MIQIQPVFKNKSVFEALAQSRGLFFEVLELSMFNATDKMYDWYKNCGMSKSIHGAFMDVNPGSGDPLIRELSERRYEESCQTALKCGAENVVFHSTCFPFLRGAYLESWTDKCVAFYTKLAEKYSNLNIFIENSPDVDPVPMNEIMKRIDAPNVKVCLDIGHINYSDTSVEKWFDVLGDKTEYLHLSDNMGKFDDHLPLGSGTVDWEKVSRLASFLPETTPVTLEIGSIESIESSLDFLKSNSLFGGVL